MQSQHYKEAPFDWHHHVPDIWIFGKVLYLSFAFIPSPAAGNLRFTEETKGRSISGCQIKKQNKQYYYAVMCVGERVNIECNLKYLPTFTFLSNCLVSYHCKFKVQLIKDRSNSSPHLASELVSILIMTEHNKWQPRGAYWPMALAL